MAEQFHTPVTWEDGPTWFQTNTNRFEQWFRGEARHCSDKIILRDTRSEGDSRGVCRWLFSFQLIIAARFSKETFLGIFVVFLDQVNVPF
jgi:hypothetical protein